VSQKIQLKTRERKTGEREKAAGVTREKER